MTQTPHNPNASFFYFCSALKYKITLSTLSLIPASARSWRGRGGKATFLLRKNVLSAPAKAHNESGQGCRAAWRERGEKKKTCAPPFDDGDDGDGENVL